MKKIYSLSKSNEYAEIIKKTNMCAPVYCSLYIHMLLF